MIPNATQEETKHDPLKNTELSLLDINALCSIIAKQEIKHIDRKSATNALWILAEETFGEELASRAIGMIEESNLPFAGAREVIETAIGVASEEATEGSDDMKTKKKVIRKAPVTKAKKAAGKKAPASKKAPVAKKVPIGDLPTAAKKVVAKAREEAGVNGHDVAKANGRGRSSTLSGKKIYPKVDKNPRREGTVAGKSMTIILKKPGLSVEDFVKAGGRLKDLRWDENKGYIELK